MYLKSLEINGFKSFAKKSDLHFNSAISSIVGPNGSGKSNVAEAFRFVLGEQSFKSMRGKRGEDLIFGGTNSLSKSNRASVKVTFDNSDKILPVDFEEVILERIVHRDGVNEYLINGSQVRLRDIMELLSSANIGSSGHHIISQGEADKILNSSIKERREMLEEALGLRIYQYKKLESQKKLDKTEENIKQVESLKREITPHLKFLQKQVEKIEEGKRMREELKIFYKSYLKLESVYLKNQKEKVSQNVSGSQTKLSEVNSQIQKCEEEAKNLENQDLLEQIKITEQTLGEAVSQKDSLIREIGNAEGQINSLNRLKEKVSNQETNQSLTISGENLGILKSEVSDLESNLENLEALKNIALRLVGFFKKIISHGSDSNEEVKFYEEEIKKAKEGLDVLQGRLQEVDALVNSHKVKLIDLRKKLEEDQSISLEARKRIIDLMAEKNQLQEVISSHAVEMDTLRRDEESFKQELTEAAVLAGRDVLDYENEIVPEDFLNRPRQEQLEKRRDLEKMKIKVEQAGSSSGEEIIREYNEVTEREKFLIQEIEDLEKSSESLRQLIIDLENQIETKFKEGLQKINIEFQKFFELMFGGGTASLKVAKIPSRRKKESDILLGDSEYFEEDTEEEIGVDIAVNLPRKKIKDLMMLSGGERALTSIALLFAISQVNPPPFIILDETDAALDEANSRKYGDMVENLSKHSQLILITHNRETMSRAGTLYGVTMTQGVSQLLSVAFEEGVQYAK